MKGVSVQLFDDAGVAYASGTNIAVMWFDSELPPDLGAIKGQSAIATTDASGYLSLDLDNVTGLAVGEFGFLVCYRLDGIDHRASLVFCSKMEVTSMTGTTVLGPLTDYVRDPDWPAQVPMVNGVQKFTGLFAVFDHDSNFVALQASGNYTVNWGDGSGDINVNAGVQAERNISYASVGGTIVGTSKAVAVTFTDTGDTVNRTAHGYQNGQRVNFATIVTTTGISTHTTYFVVGRTANTFQVASTLGGSALPLTTDGSGTVYIPEYKVVIVTVIPQAGQNLTALDLQKKHSSMGTGYPLGPWLDIAINVPMLSTGLLIRGASTEVEMDMLLEVALGENSITNFSSLFAVLRSLQAVNRLDCSSGTTFVSLFNGCGALRSIPYIDVSLGTDFTGAFSATSFQSLPLLDTSSALSLSALLAGCYSLRSVPALVTSSCSNFSSMFSECSNLVEVPWLDTSSGNNFTEMFAYCNSIRSIPAIDTSLGTNMYGMFTWCYSLTTIPEINTSMNTNFGWMFSYCSALKYIPKLDTSSANSLAGTFHSCYALTTIPQMNTVSCFDFYSTFSYCSSLQTLPRLNLSGISSALDFTFLAGCYSLSVARFDGLAQNIVYSNCRLSAIALDDIYTGLATVVGKTITVTGNPGVSGDDPTIATAKGWTVVG